MKLTKNGISVIAHASCIESMLNNGWTEEAAKSKPSSKKENKKNEE